MLKKKKSFKVRAAIYYSNLGNVVLAIKRGLNKVLKAFSTYLLSIAIEILPKPDVS